MIPRCIHYCWFGDKPLPDATQRYIDSWHQYLPDFQFKLWHEQNFDVSALAYTREAYAAGKYAFVADVCRIQALLTEGGIYLDTDVQLIASLEPFLHHHCFTGFEEGMDPYNRTLTCQPQAGVMGCEPGSALMADVWQYYQHARFDPVHPITINQVFRHIYQQHGVVFQQQIQHIADYFSIYPSDYFMAKNAYTHELNITEHTVCIHHYDGSWLNGHSSVHTLKRRLLTLLRYTLGAERARRLIQWLKRVKS
ncbi:glycosyltransferase [Neisseriaceae bacterium ESL0693]|nr:glycosyltransferase [Neisseriaceae bacterium ESL0693]